MDTDNRVVNPEAEGKGELEGVNGEEKGDIRYVILSLNMKYFFIFKKMKKKKLF